VKEEKKEELIFDLIFSDQISFNIDISDYIDNIYKYEEFITEIKKILKKSKVTITDSYINTDIKTVIWELKVNRK
jgi:hypothetical protein